MKATWTSEEYERIFEHCVRISSSLELGDVVESSLDALAATLPHAGVLVSVIEDGAIVVLGGRAPADPRSSKGRLRLERGGPIARAAIEQRPVYSPDLYEEDLLDRRLRASAGFGDPRSLLAVPLVVNGATVGVIHALAAQADAFSEGDQAVLISLAPAIGAALTNAHAIGSERAAWEQERELDEQQALFVWLASAELWEPLVAMRRLTQQLGTADDVREVAAGMIESGLALNGQVEAILQLSTEPPHPARTETFDVVEALVEIGRARPDEPVQVRADRARFLQVMAHVAPEGAQVVVETDFDRVRLFLPGVNVDRLLLGALAKAAGATLEGDSQLVLPRTGDPE